MSSEWQTAERALAYLARADTPPHQESGFSDVDGLGKRRERALLVGTRPAA
jgi:hypothetical protein